METIKALFFVFGIIFGMAALVWLPSEIADGLGATASDQFLVFLASIGGLYGLLYTLAMRHKR